MNLQDFKIMLDSANATDQKDPPVFLQIKLPEDPRTFKVNVRAVENDGHGNVIIILEPADQQ